jgi:hypothetical protein
VTVLVSNPDPADVGEDAVVSAYTRAGVYAASGSIRPDGAIEDVSRELWADAVVVTPSLYGMCVRTDAPGEIRDVLAELACARVGALFVAGVDPGRQRRAAASGQRARARHRRRPLPGDLRLRGV